ncbi:TPA: phage tail protein, partial [Vibrio cholerae O1]
MDNPETLLPKFFAFEDALMLEHVEDAIEITEQQYKDALAAKMAGRKAFVRDG